MAIDEIAVDYRKVNFVIAHSGNPWVQTAAEIAYKNPNVYIEGSAMLIGDLSEYSRQQLDEYIVKPLKWAFGYIEDPSKFMFGSDYALVDIKAYAEIYKRAIPREHWDAVFRDNAVKVFKLDQLHGSKEK
jgi:predicted TIM-barrel fold metal-dependent hydrolase